MSTKTLRKRVALIAVSAMGLGLISGVSTPANAATGNVVIASTSVGVLASSITSGSTANTATVLNTGQIDLTVPSDSVTVTKVALSAGAYISAGTNETVAADQLSASTSYQGNAALSVRITGAVGSTFTISTSKGDSLFELITVTVAGTSVAGVASTTNSTATWSATPTLGLDKGGVDSATGAETTTGNKLYLNIQIKDAYKAAVTSATGALIVTSSTGANVGFAAVGTFSTAVLGTSPSNVNVWVTEATAGAGWSGTVSVTYNGVAIATKSGKITGNVAKLTVAVAKVADDGTTTAKAMTFKAADAAGNQIALAASAVAFTSSSNAAVVSTASGANGDATSTDVGYITVTGGTAGSADVVVQTTIAATGAVVKSNSVKVLVGGAADTFSAAFDKAKYAQGDIATLTISFKDAKGFAANSVDSVTTASAIDATITAPMFGKIGTVPSINELPNAAGQIVYKFNVGDVSGTFTPGKYNAVVTYNKLTNSTAQTVAYEVTGAGVTNSDILASIVKLITAINKQIAALQKLLLKK